MNIKKRSMFYLLLFFGVLFIPSMGHASTLIQGVALNSPTNVYEQTSTGSKVLKSYTQGTILKYRNYSSEWYQSTVYLNGQATTGYIHKNSVDNIYPVTENLKGVAKTDPTKVYSKPSEASSALKQYAEGTLLIYKSFSSEWHKATVYVRGNRTTGYIKTADVETGSRNPISYKGIALSSPTSVYTKTDKNSKALKSYPKDTVLLYKSFVTNWYKATVYVSGEPRDGYIHVNDVRNGDMNPVKYRGVALKAPTTVYSQAYTGSRALKKYEQGRILAYNSFVPGWYQTTVYVNGTPRNGYINASDVENSVGISNTISVRAVADTVHARTFASSSAPSLTTYKRDSIFEVQAFTSSWYKVTVNGKTGYISKSETSTDLQPDTYLNLDLRKKANITAADIVNFFNVASPNSHLKNYAQSYIDAQSKYGVNAAYLVAHAIWETGWGRSDLSIYKNNLYGYGAYDVCPVTCGFYYPSAEASIDTVAYNVKVNYLNTNGVYYYPQHGSTLIGMNVRYATDQNWKNGIANLMQRIKPYDSGYYSSAPILPLNSSRPAAVGREIPKGNPVPSSVVNFPQGTAGVINSGVSFRTLPYTSSATLIRSLTTGTTVEVLGYNTDVRLNDKYPYDYRWYRVSVEGQEGWVYGGSLDIQELLQVVNVTTTLNIRNAPKTGDVVGSVAANGILVPVLKDGKPEVVDNWYHVHLPDAPAKTGYVSGDFIKIIKN